MYAYDMRATDNAQLFSEKAAQIVNKQTPMDVATIERVKKALANKGVALEQSPELDKWLLSKNAEAITFSDSTIVMHTKVSASGFFEELIHYGQLKNKRAVFGDFENNLLLEIEAKERLLRYRKAYKITDYEVEVLTEVLDRYKIQLEIL